MSITNASNISSGQLADRRLNTVLQDLSTMTYSTDSVVAYEEITLKQLHLIRVATTFPLIFKTKDNNNDNYKRNFTN